VTYLEEVDDEVDVTTGRGVDDTLDEVAGGAAGVVEELGTAEEAAAEEAADVETGAEEVPVDVVEGRLELERRASIASRFCK
jgi:hypothetical protein